MNATQRQHQYTTTTTSSGRRDSGIFLASEGYGRAANEAEAPADREELSGIRRIPRSEADEEQALVASLVDNDPMAWREFRQRYDRLVLRCITKVTKRFAAVSQDDVREIYAQLLVSLLANDRSKLRAFDPARGSRFSSYIGMLAIHCTYDWLRAVRREPPRETLNEAFELSSDLPDPFEATAAQERAALAERVMAGFSERDRTFAALYFGEGMEPHEIARSMKISVKTVYSKKHKIQSKLESIVAAIKGSHAA
ncbi:MAG TPA: sigma-70 family RNA polymerase sigma factor [Polyangiaceae bacterium]|jgi:RNA polymerase sigma-70 factor (ECF subfamily)